MVLFPVPRVVSAAAVACLLLSPDALSQTPALLPAKGAPSPATKLEELSQAFASIDGEFSQAVEATRKLVETELAAKRLSNPLAATVQSALRGAKLHNKAPDTRAVLGLQHVGIDNAALADALDDLHLKVARLLTQRRALAAEAPKELRRRVLETIGTAKTGEEVERQSAVVDRLKDDPGLEVTMQSIEWGLMLEHAADILRKVKTLVDAEASSELPKIASALSDFRSEGPPFPDDKVFYRARECAHGSAAFRSPSRKLLLPRRRRSTPRSSAAKRRRNSRPRLLRTVRPANVPKASSQWIASDAQK